MKRKLSMSKCLILFLFINCIVIEIYTMFTIGAQFKLAEQIGVMPDFSPLTSLVGAVVAEVVGYAIYALKSMKQNTAGGIVYEMAMQEQNQQLEL